MPRLYFKDKAFGADNHWLEKQFPGKEIRVVSRTRDEHNWLVMAESDTEPGKTVLFDRKTRRSRRSTRSGRRFRVTGLAEMKSVTLQIVRWLGDSGLS